MGKLQVFIDKTTMSNFATFSDNFPLWNVKLKQLLWIFTYFPLTVSLPYHSQWWKRFPLNKRKDIWEDEDGNLKDRKKGGQWELLCDAQQIVTSRGWFSRIKCGRWSFILVISVYSSSHCLNTGNVRPPGSFIYFFRIWCSKNIFLIMSYIF